MVFPGLAIETFFETDDINIANYSVIGSLLQNLSADQELVGGFDIMPVFAQCLDAFHVVVTADGLVIS